MYFKFVKIFLVTIVTVSLFLFLIIIWNRNQIKPTNYELMLLKKHFKNIDIRDESDIFRISKIVVNDIVHKKNLTVPLSIARVVDKGEGFCYDRSLILQKIFIYNGIPIRPVYIYYSPTGEDVTIFNLLDKNLMSHNVFEYYYNGKWNLMKTNSKLMKTISLQEYLDHSKIVPKNSGYIRYLNNRNGQFIYPSFIPDIYYY